MASFNKFNQFVEDVAKKVHNLTSEEVLSAMLAAEDDEFLFLQEAA